MSRQVQKVVYTYDIVTHTYEPNRDVLTQVQNQFGTNIISQYDYTNDELAQHTSMTTSGTAFDSAPQPTVSPDTSTYTTNALNQYTSIQYSVSSIQLTYDIDGNLTDDGIHHFTYDAENRLTSVTPITPTAGSTKVEFAYDYMSRRVQKKVYVYNAGSWSLDTEKSFVYDGWNLIKEQTTTGGTTSTDYYVWGLDLSGTLQGAGGIGGLLSKTNNLTSQTFLYTFDANGNVGQLVDSSTGAIAAHYEYDPFGKLLVATGPEADSNVFRFSTKYYDAETGLYDYGFRNYLPNLGRFISRDPIEENGGINLYSFVGNNPINLLDVLGLAVHLSPLNGRAENHSSKVITIRGDWYIVTCKKDSTTVTKRPWSEAGMHAFITWKKIRGYTCTKTIGSDTYQLEPEKSMVSEWDAGNTFIVDSDHWIELTNFTVYKDKQCCEEEKEKEIKIGPGILRVYDCPKETKCPNDTEKKGLYYDIDVNWVPGF